MARTRQKPTFTGKWRQAFLAALAKEGVVSEAARKAKVCRTYVYEVREADATFAAAWDDAIQQAVDALELVAIRRARKKSDRLLAYLLTARRPEVYGRRLSVEHSGGVTLEIVEVVEDGSGSRSSGNEGPATDRPSTPESGGVSPQ